jgi:hypothetical protein
MRWLCRPGNKYLRRACWSAAQTVATHRVRENHPIGQYIRHLKTTNGRIHKNFQSRHNEISRILKKWEFVYTEIKSCYEEFHKESNKFDELWKQIMRLDIPIPTTFNEKVGVNKKR